MKKCFLFIVLFGCFYSCVETTNDPLKFQAELPKAYKELSGITMLNDTLFGVEDSGNDNVLVALDSTGKIIKETNLSCKNIDFEALTINKEGAFFVGDFGNNDNERKDLAIYKVSSLKTEKIAFSYPEQEDFPPKKAKLFYDCEAFFEWNDHLYLFTKNRSSKFDGSSFIYKIPAKAGVHEAQLLGEIKTCAIDKTCLITDAAISPDGQKVVLLCHDKLFLLNNFSEDKLNKTENWKPISLGHNSQKEAICFKNNNTLFIADERAEKQGGNLYSFTLN